MPTALAVAARAVFEGDDALMVTTNIAVLDVDDVEIEVGRLSPYDEQRHDALVAEFGDSHVFRRRADSLEWVRVEGSHSIVGDVERRRIRALGGLLCVLLEDALGRGLIAGRNEIACIRRRPLMLVSRQPKNDLAQTLFGRRTHGRLPLHVRRAFTLEVRQIRGARGRRYGLIVDARTINEIDGNCEDLLADGVDLKGLYVQAASDRRDRLVNESRQTIGMIAAVTGSESFLEQIGIPIARSSMRASSPSILGLEQWRDSQRTT